MMFKSSQTKGRRANRPEKDPPEPNPSIYDHKKSMLLKTVGAVAAGLILSSAYASRYEMPTLESFQERGQNFGVKLTAPSFPDSKEAIEAEMTLILDSLKVAGDAMPRWGSMI